MKLNFTENDIYEAEFKTSFRGYNKEQVDEFLDKIMEDYITLQEMVEELQGDGVKTVVAPVEEVTEEPSKMVETASDDDFSFEFIRPKTKNVTDEVPPLSSLFNFESDDDGADVEELLSSSNRNSNAMDNTNYDLIKRLAQLEKEVANLRSTKR